MREILERQRKWVSKIEKRTGKVIPSVFCRSDGTPIRLFRLSPQGPVAGQEQAREEIVLRSKALVGQMIRVAPPGWESNCCGWVFAGGKFWAAHNRS